MAHYQFVIADDHPLFRGALQQTLADMFPDSDLKVAGSLEELKAVIESTEDIDLILLDLKMPGVQGFAGLMFVRAQFPNIPVVIVSANDDPVIIHSALERFVRCPHGRRSILPGSRRLQRVTASANVLRLRPPKLRKVMR